MPQQEKTADDVIKSNQQKKNKNERKAIENVT